MPTYWCGPVPICCSLCSGTFGGTFIDGATRAGFWGYLCEWCHLHQGCGLGTGRGQKYVRQPDGRWLKEE